MIYRNLKHYLVTYKGYKGNYMKMSIWAHDECECEYLFFEKFPKYQVIEIELIKTIPVTINKYFDEELDV